MTKRILPIVAAFLVVLTACTASRPELGEQVGAPTDLAFDDSGTGDNASDVDPIDVTGEIGDSAVVTPDGPAPKTADERPDSFVVNDDGVVVPKSGELIEQYGSTPILDHLHDSCVDGFLTDCDSLYFASPPGTDYELMAITCGGRGTEHYGTCEIDLGGGSDTDIDTEIEVEDLTGLFDGILVFGDDPALDALWTSCAGGDMVACDQLFFTSPIGSSYETFGDTCGNTSPSTSGGCTAGFATDGDDAGGTGDSAASSGNDYGDHDGFDALWDACGAGSHDACDDLWGMSPIGSGYETFGDTCGDTTVGAAGGCSAEFGTSSGNDLEAVGYGDDPGLDAVHDSCAASGGEACDLLFDMSPIDSTYESFALTCGDRRELSFDSCG